MTIANGFDTFYVNIGPSLSCLQNGNTTSPLSYMKRRLQNSVFVAPVEALKIKTIIMSLKNSSPGWDEISSSVIKDSHLYIIKPLMYIFNLSVSHGVFPQELKLFLYIRGITMRK